MNWFSLGCQTTVTESVSAFSSEDIEDAALRNVFSGWHDYSDKEQNHGEGRCVLSSSSSNNKNNNNY